MSNLKHHSPPGLLHNPNYSHTVVASGGRTVYIAGQVPTDADGKLVGGSDLGAQTAQAMKNVGIALAAAGASYENIVKLTTYVVNYKPEHRAIVGKARGAHFTKGPPPASTLVGVSALAMSEWLVEIEAIAVID
jgi:enamine deaminase RidA (YjgF/YER057c/UK114 family)